MPDPFPVNLIPAPEPGGEFSFMQMIPTLVFDVAMPIVEFNVLVHYGFSTLWAQPGELSAARSTSAAVG